MGKRSKTRRILWALDPFSTDSKLLLKTAHTLQVLADLEHDQIEPVYILSPDNFNWTGDFSGAWVNRFLPTVKEAMLKILNETGLDSLPPQILISRTHSMRKDAEKLLSYAKRVKARSIVLNTRARSGLGRMIMGSFAETVLLLTKQPVILVNPDSKELRRIQRIIFPTDFSKEAARTFQQVLQAAQRWHAEVHIFHKIPDPIEPMVQVGVQMAGGGWVSVHEFLLKESAEAHKSCAKLAAIAEKAGLKAHIFVDQKPGYLVDGINAYASQVDADLIMMASKASSTSAILIGSIARQLARSSHQPLWVQH